VTKLWRQIALLVGIVVVTTVVAELLGAANLGVSLGIAQIVFAIALTAIIYRG
jgi:hypothetical protein